MSKMRAEMIERMRAIFTELQGAIASVRLKRSSPTQMYNTVFAAFKSSASFSKIAFAAATISLLLLNTVAAQSAEQEEALELLETAASQARITTQVDTPQHCIALFWWNRLQWDSLWQEAYVYSPTGELLETVHEAYQSNAFVPEARSTVTYNVQGEMIERIVQNWASNTWTNASRTTWGYDATGNDTLSWQFSWHLAVTGDYWDTITGSRNRLQYGPANQISEREISYWSPGLPFGTWTRASKNNYFFNGLGQWDSLVTSSPAGLSWVPISRMVGVQWHDYAQQQRSAYKTQYYQGTWLNAIRNTCTFTGLDNLCYTETYNASVWDTAYREYQYYDAAQNLTQWERQDYNAGQWMVNSGVEHQYVYDGLGHIVEVVDRIWDPQIGYLNNEKRVYDEFFVVQTAAPRPQIEVTAFPNPVVDRLHFRMDRPGPAHITVTDMQGLLRMECFVAVSVDELELQISDLLPNGSYCYRISTRVGEAQGKFILLRP